MPPVVSSADLKFAVTRQYTGERIVYSSYLVRGTIWYTAPIWFIFAPIFGSYRGLFGLPGTIWFTLRASTYSGDYLVHATWTPLWSSGRTSSHSMDTLNTVSTTR